MWSHEDIFDILRNCAPYYIIIALPLLILISPMPAAASVEFSVFRLQQFELHGATFGSQSSLVNMEARTIDSGSLARRCVISSIFDLTSAKYIDLISQGAAALLILIPKHLHLFSEEKKQKIRELEETLLDSEVQLAVYFAYENDNLRRVYESVRTSHNTDGASSAAAALISSLASDGYQMVISGSQSKKITDSTIANIHGKLVGYGMEEQLPTIAIVAYYDSFGASPELSFGADSNASGVVVLLEAARILSRLYSSSRTHPKMNIIFLLSGGAHLNYQGSKRFLEDQLESPDATLFSEAHFVLCIDTVANGDTLHMHVSKKPKDNSPSGLFYESLVNVSSSFNLAVNMCHKKINLQDDKQSWEHEKYSLKRLPAFTLSRLMGPKTLERGSIVDTFDGLDVTTLTTRTSLIITSLLQHIYNTSINDVLKHGLSVSEESISSWLSLLSFQPRSPQLLTNKNNQLIHSLHQALSRYTTETKVSYIKADRRDPEWVFYDITTARMTAYAVKAASFDFFLTLLIVAYLGIIYIFVMYFPRIYTTWVKLTTSERLKIQ